MAHETTTTAVSEEQIGSMFDKISPRYDLLNRTLSAGQDIRWRNYMIRRLPNHPEHSTLLDMATGTGDVLLQVMKKRQDFDALIGIDISSGMLDVARRKLEPVAKRLGRPLRLEVASAERIPLDDMSVDAITIAFGLRNVVDKDRALKEFARVLKPNGRLFILEFFDPKPGPMSGLFLFYFRHVLPRIGGLLSDKQAYTYLPKSVQTFYTPSSMRSALQACGLAVSHEKDFLFGACRLIEAQRG